MCILKRRRLLAQVRMGIRGAGDWCVCCARCWLRLFGSIALSRGPGACAAAAAATGRQRRSSPPWSCPPPAIFRLRPNCTNRRESLCGAVFHLGALAGWRAGWRRGACAPASSSWREDSASASPLAAVSDCQGTSEARPGLVAVAVACQSLASHPPQGRIQVLVHDNMQVVSSFRVRRAFVRARDQDGTAWRHGTGE